MTSLPTAEDLVRDYRQWLLKQAAMLLPGRQADWQDLAQEGHIAMWKALQTYDPAKGALPSWLTTAARLRMRDCVRRNLWTGTPSARGHVRDRAPTPAEDDFLEERAPEVVYDGLALAYHHGEIIEVLNSLTPSQRSAIFRRFWLDESVATGYYWQALPKLREALEHLRDCC